MRIYVASSWRNPYQPAVVSHLRTFGFEVYDFKSPDPSGGFSWKEVDPRWQEWSLTEYRKALLSSAAVRGFERDMEALRRCDACVLVQPCGTSAHLELGWAVGAKKRTVVLFPVDYEVDASLPPDQIEQQRSRLSSFEAELMARMADHILIGSDEMDTWSQNHRSWSS